MSLVNNAFLFLFLPAVVALNALLPQKYRNYVLLAADILFFVLVQNTVCMFLVLILTLLNWLLALPMERGAAGKMLLGIGVATDVLSLAFFKYYDFFMEPDAILPLAVPLGISYFTFKNIGYLCGVYRGGEKERNPVDYAAYALLFAQITQGPIQKYGDVRAELRSRTVTAEKIGQGTELFVLGFAMKTLLTQRPMGLYTSAFNAGIDAASTPMAWLTVLSFILCLYLDFWGYSLMADGICRMLGFSGCENFNEPYSSRSVAEFWRRWHISLGTFFKENVYFPLGGSRHGTFRLLLSTVAVWLLTGIWHGEGLTFLVWGMISCVCILGERLSAKYKGPLYRIVSHPVLSHVYIVLYALVSWSVFMCESLTQWKDLWLRLIPLRGSAEYVIATDFTEWLRPCALPLLLGLVFCTPYPRRLWEKIRRYPFLSVPLLLILFWVSVYMTAIAGANPFMYAGF